MEVADWDSDQLSTCDLVFYADLGNKRDSIAHAYEALDGLKRGKFYVHVEGCFVALKGLDDLVAVGRSDDVGDKGFRAQLVDADLSGVGQRMIGGNDERKFVEIHDDRFELRVLRIIGKDAEFDVVLEDIIGNVAAERTADGDFDGGMETAEFGEDGQKVEGREFVGRDVELAFLKLAELDESFLGVLTEVHEFFGVFLEDTAGVGEDSVTGRAVEERLADFEFELADGLTDRGLGAEELLGGAGEAALAGNGEKDFELGKIHGTVPNC